VASVGRSAWNRMSSGIVARSAKREEEILRQLSDVFKELAHLSVDVGALWSSLEETKGKLDDAHRKLDAQAAILSELSDTVNEQIDIGNESTELLGRLLQSARGRLDVLEGSRQNPA
jgi:ABC-type transporter Mla subunit MlaD